MIEPTCQEAQLAISYSLSEEGLDGALRQPSVRLQLLHLVG